jgi:hypothetical protein
MHDTTVKLKDGRILIGPILAFKPELGFMTLMGDNDEKLNFENIVSATTEGERIGHGKIGTQDEIQRAKSYLKDARKYGWHDPLPVQDWESEDHQTGFRRRI